MKQDPALELLAEFLPELQKAFSHLPEAESAGAPRNAMREVLAQVAGRMADNYPYFHPLYAGQMLKPPHPIARAAYALAMWINPNNHALDGGRASSRLEVEAVREIAAMFGWMEYLGAPDERRHLCQSGGDVGGGTTCSGKKDCRVGPGALYTWTHQRSAGAPVCQRSGR